MKLTHYLRKAGYDLIEGPIRNHKPLQLWIKQGFNQPELYYADISHAFQGKNLPGIITDPALSVDEVKSESYAFNIGITLLKEILQAIGLSTFDLSGLIKSGKKVKIGYRQSITETVPVGEITDFFSSADFLHVNPILLNHANRNNLIFISGVVQARQLVVNIDTDMSVDKKLTTGLEKAAKGKLSFNTDGKHSLNMVSQTSDLFPIAVKASRLDFDKGQFRGLSLLTDNRNLF